MQRGEMARDEQNHQDQVFSGWRNLDSSPGVKTPFQRCDGDQVPSSLQNEVGECWQNLSDLVCTLSDIIPMQAWHVVMFSKQ